MAQETKIVVNGVLTDVLQSDYSAQQMDDAIARAMPGGVIDASLSNKAPAGYGLGGYSRVVASGVSVDTVTVNGWYNCQGVAGLPASVGTYGYLFVESLGDNYVNQYYAWSLTSSTDSYNYHIQRNRSAGVWGAWEYVNPPMLPGAEYRTTERYGGKPVYVKVVDCGAAPLSTWKSVENGIANIFAIISVTGYMTNGTSTISLPYARDTNENLGSIWAMNTVITVWCVNSDFTGYTVYGILKYTKTTD